MYFTGNGIYSVTRVTLDNLGKRIGQGQDNVVIVDSSLALPQLGVVSDKTLHINP